MMYDAYLVETHNSKAVFLDQAKATDYAATGHGIVTGLVSNAVVEDLRRQISELEMQVKYLADQVIRHLNESTGEKLGN